LAEDNLGLEQAPSPATVENISGTIQHKAASTSGIATTTSNIYHRQKNDELTLGFTDPSQAIGLVVMDSNPAPMPASQKFAEIILTCVSSLATHFHLFFFQGSDDRSYSNSALEKTMSLTNIIKPSFDGCSYISNCLKA